MIKKFSLMIRPLENVVFLNSTDINEIDELLTENQIFKIRTQGIGIITPEQAIDWGLSGPMIRGSGVRYDVRKFQPYCVYDRPHVWVSKAESNGFALYPR